MNLSSTAPLTQTSASGASTLFAAGAQPGAQGFDLLLGMVLGSLAQGQQGVTGEQQAALLAQATAGQQATQSPTGLLAASTGAAAEPMAPADSQAHEQLAGTNETVASLLAAMAQANQQKTGQASQSPTQPAATATPATQTSVAATPAQQIARQAAAKTTYAPTAEPKPAEVKIWNVRELAHRLNSALETPLAEAETPAATTTDKTAGTTGLASQLHGEQIRSAGTRNLMNATAATAPDQTPTVAQATPASAAPAAQTGEATLVAALQTQTTAQEGQSRAAAARSVLPKTKLAEEATDTTPVAMADQGQMLEWAAQPVESSEGSRMPTMIEQVSQISEFMAERTEGVIKLGQKGVEANLRLYPPDLGGVRVELTVNNDRTTQAQFIVERPETAQLLQQNMQSLQEGLARQGLVVDKMQVSVQVLPSAGAQEGAWNQSNSQSQSRRDSGLLQQRNNQNQRQGQHGQQAGKDTQQFA